MHPTALPQEIVDRVRARRGRLHPFDRLAPSRTALVVIDMQNAFCAPGAAIEVPVARSVVPNINRLAAAVRSSGGLVVWVQMTIKDEADWPVFLSALVSDGNAARSDAEHLATLVAFIQSFGDVRSTDELIGLLRGHS